VEITDYIFLIIFFFDFWLNWLNSPPRWL